ncbi:MAG: hypothetical protein ACRDRP_08655 [Pseudonocardiaceae bacterium]
MTRAGIYGERLRWAASGAVGRGWPVAPGRVAEPRPALAGADLSTPRGTTAFPAPDQGV